MDNYSRFRWRHRARKLKRNLHLARLQASNFISKYLLRRTPRLKAVQRFTLIWFFILGIAFFGLIKQFNKLPAYYVVSGPKSGGVVTEGVVSEITNLNPIFQEGGINDMAASLIFSGLVRYTADGRVQPDLADSWKIEDDGKKYTFTLHPHVNWHDGKPFTAKDVVFTFKTIQNPSVLSPLSPNWRDVVISAPNDRTVVFTLPSEYSPFIYSLTTGILPEHLLAGQEAASLRKAEFNQNPVGTGPFKFKEIGLARDEVRLLPNTDFYRGIPRLDGYILKSFDTYEALENAYVGRQVSIAGGFRPADIASLSSQKHIDVRHIPLDNESFAFYNTNRPLLSDKNLRQALNYAVKTEELIKPYGEALTGPSGVLLPGQLGYLDSRLPYDKPKAAALLDQVGWKVAENGLRKKDNKFLKLGLVTQDDDIYPAVAQNLAKQWREVGVQVDIKLVPLAELKQSYIRPRNYDIVVTEINIGADPDVFAFWHSSQAKDPGLNLSAYSSSSADSALVSGRSRSSKPLRAAKYEQFQNTWRDDAPALALFRPNYLYVRSQNLLGLNVIELPVPVARYYNVEEWTNKTEKTLLRLHPELVLQQGLRSR